MKLVCQIKPWGHVLIAIAFSVLFNPISAAAQEPQNVSFDDFKFEMKKGEKFKDSMITDEIKAFVGKKIIIRGYILPTSTSKLKQFIFVRDNKECCFGPGAMLYDCMVVKMKKGLTTKFTTRPIAVEGEFKIKKLGPAESPLAIYELTGLKVN
jgi:hypothetical protein